MLLHHNTFSNAWDEKPSHENEVAEMSAEEKPNDEHDEVISDGNE